MAGMFGSVVWRELVRNDWSSGGVLIKRPAHGYSEKQLTRKRICFLALCSFAWCRVFRSGAVTFYFCAKGKALQPFAVFSRRLIPQVLAVDTIALATTSTDRHAALWVETGETRPTLCIHVSFRCACPFPPVPVNILAWVVRFAYCFRRRDVCTRMR